MRENNLENGTKIESEKPIRPKFEGTVSLTSEEINSIDEKISEYITKEEAARNYKCNLCGKCAKTRQHIQNHAIEIEFIKMLI